jgi:hypothetical protein
MKKSIKTFNYLMCSETCLEKTALAIKILFEKLSILDEQKGSSEKINEKLLNGSIWIRPGLRLRLCWL